MKKKVILETDWILDFFDLKKVQSPILKEWTQSQYNFSEIHKLQMLELANQYAYCLRKIKEFVL